MRHSYITRRQMLAGTAGALAGITLTGSCAVSQPKPEKAKTQKPAGPGFKLGVCDWTIGKRADPASFEIAKRIGLDGVQVDFGGGENRPTLFNLELQQKLLQEAKKQGMEISSMAMSVLNEVPLKSDPRAPAWVNMAIDYCKYPFGAKVILLAFFGNGDLRNNEQGINTVVNRLKEIAPRAEKAGVTLGFESWLSAQQHIDIIERIGSPAVKVYYDVANSHKMGYDIYKEIRQLGKLICEFHLKDYNGLYGMGSIDFKRVREAIDEIGYRGWMVMEGTQMPLGVEQSCQYDAKYLRTIFPSKT